MSKPIWRCAAVCCLAALLSTLGCADGAAVMQTDAPPALPEQAPSGHAAIPAEPQPSETSDDQRSQPAAASPLTPFDNFHAIADGQAYRSAQVRPETLDYAASTLGVRTVINLRGENPDQDWYQAERRACADLGLRLIDVRLGSSDLPAPEELLKLYDALKDSEGPILMHCHSGADRSGLAAALWRIITLGENAASAADHELTLRYGHLRVRKPAMTDMVEMFVPSREWIVEQYPALRAEYLQTRDPGGRR